MIARSHYDRFTLEEFLNNALPETDAPPESDSDIALHLEQCRECQSTLESLLGEGLTMEAAGGLLRDCASDELTWEPTRSERLTELDRSTFLEPSDHPESLGRFARFEIMEFLGLGGMGIVMRGFDTSLNRHSAVKVLAPELATSAAARKRFSREAKSAAAVVHPHVVPIQTVDEHDGLPYLVMPVVEGQSVDARVRESGPVTVIEAVRIASQIAEGLGAAHAQGLVHRDIKPANVLLENGVERVQITDFGLARAIDDASMTRSGVIAGTPQYMSPEQAHGDSIDHRSDLFSLGSLIYFMLTGHSPFRAETTMGVLNRIGNEQPRSLRSINADIPEWLEQIVMKLLAKPREDRFQTASEVAELLQRWHAHLQQPDAVDPPEKLDRKSLPLAKAAGAKGGLAKWLIAMAAFGFLAFAGVLIVLELDKGTLTIESEADDIPIRIMQGDQIVKQLTVSRRGFTTRLSAGKYVIEVDDPSAAIDLLGNQVTLKRGQSTIARISLRNQPPAVGDESRLIQRLQGKWRVVRIVDPEGADYKPRKATGWIIEGHKFTNFGEHIQAELPFRLDETQVPAQFDVLIASEGNSGLLGLIDVTGDTLKVVNSKNTGGESDPTRPVKLEPALGFHYCEMVRVIEPTRTTLDDAAIARESLFQPKPTEILTPKQALDRARLWVLASQMGLPQPSVAVRFRVGSVAKQIRYGDYSAWYLCPSEQPSELGAGYLKVWIWPAAEAALKAQGIADLESHFAGKTITISGPVTSVPAHLGGSVSPPFSPSTWIHSMELESVDQLTVHESPPESMGKTSFNTPTVLAALQGRWQELDHDEGPEFNQTLVFSGGALGQWYERASTLPISITYYVEGDELILQFNHEPESAFDYRLKQLRFEYELDGDSLVFTRDGVTTRLKRIRDANAETAPPKDEGSVSDASSQGTMNGDTPYCLVWESGGEVRLRQKFADTLDLDGQTRTAVESLLTEIWAEYIDDERDRTKYSLAADGDLVAEIGDLANDRKGLANEFLSKLRKFVSDAQRDRIWSAVKNRTDRAFDEIWKSDSDAYPSLLGWSKDNSPIRIEIHQTADGYSWYVRPGSHGVTGSGKTLPPELQHYLEFANKAMAENATTIGSE
ncbi:MAG: protein kinase [Rubripirellula sp.]